MDCLQCSANTNLTLQRFGNIPNVSTGNQGPNCELHGSGWGLLLVAQWQSQRVPKKWTTTALLCPPPPTRPSSQPRRHPSQARLLLGRREPLCSTQGWDSGAGGGGGGSPRASHITPSRWPLSPLWVGDPAGVSTVCTAWAHTRTSVLSPGLSQSQNLQVQPAPLLGWVEATASSPQANKILKRVERPQTRKAGAGSF